MATVNKYPKIQSRYGVGLDTQYVPHLPIIGNVIPQKHLYTFTKQAYDNGDWWDDTVLWGTGSPSSDWEWDYIRGYTADAIPRKKTVDIVGANIFYFMHEFEEPVDFRQIGEDLIRKYSTNKKTGDMTEFMPWAGDRSQIWKSLFFVLEMNSAAITPTSGSLYEKYTILLLDEDGVQCASGGHSQTGTSEYQRHGIWNKRALAVGSNAEYGAFYPNSGFDWTKVKKIAIQMALDGGGSLPGTGGGASVKSLKLAISPYKYVDRSSWQTAANSSYPQVEESNSVFLSTLYGDDANSGLQRDLPKRTVEGAVGVTTAARHQVCILDSEAYDATYNNAFPHTNPQAFEVTFVADYTETPSFKMSPGLLRPDMIGARLGKRTKWYTGGGSTLYVNKAGSGGAYTTINAAYTAASSGDCIEINDDGVYDEQLLLGTKNITIQAAPGNLPTWKYSGTHPVIRSIWGYSGSFYGIIFEGKSSSLIISFNNFAAGSVTLEVWDCTFKDVEGNCIIADKNVHLENNWVLSEQTGNTSFMTETNSGSDVVCVNNLAYFSEDPSAFSNFYTQKDPTRTSQPKTAVVKYNKVVGAGQNIRSFYMGAGPGTHSVNATTQSIFFNDFVGLCHWDFTNHYPGTLYFVGNSITGIAAGSPFVNDNILFENAPHGSQTWNLYVKGNFVKTTLYSGSAGNCFRWKGTSTDLKLFVEANVFTGYTGLNIDTGASWDTNNEVKNNIFEGLVVKGIDDNATITMNNVDGNVFVNCDKAIEANVLNGSEAIFYNNTNANTGTITITNEYDEDPLFVDVSTNDYRWLPLSPLQTYTPFHACAYGGIQSYGYNLIRFDGAKWLKGISQGTADVTVHQSWFEGFCIAIEVEDEAQTYQITQNRFEDNGYGVWCPIIETDYSNTDNDVINCIFKDNVTGILNTGTLDIAHVTALDNVYGLFAEYTSFYAQNPYSEKYATVTDSIFYDSSVYDYYGTLETRTCIIGTRYRTDSGVGNTDTAPFLDSDDYPANIYTGFTITSPAFETATDGTNIGARNVNEIKTELDYTAYTFNGNPQHFDLSMREVNLKSTINVNGIYESVVDKEVQMWQLEWEQAPDAQIPTAQKEALIGIYTSSWVVGISIDSGSTWVYYKVVKETKFGIKQKRFHAPEIGYEGVKIDIIEIPDFEIDSYLRDDFPVAP